MPSSEASHRHGRTEDGRRERERIDRMLVVLGRSSFRARFALKGSERTYAEKRGLDEIRTHAREFVTARIAPVRPPNDGRQTPMRRHPVFVAQHATATCCRRCIERWHRIPRGTALGDADIDYIVTIIMAWIERELAANNREEP